MAQNINKEIQAVIDAKVDAYIKATNEFPTWGMLCKWEAEAKEILKL